MRPLAVFAALAVALTAGIPATTTEAEFPGRTTRPELIGRAAPPLAVDRWLNADGQVEVGDFAGRVLLVRWWTDTCPFCSTTAPVLNRLLDDYGDRGLSVIGIFHPKPAGDRSLARAQRAARRFGFAFPVGLDPDWRALRRWWLGEGRGWTSVTFLVDPGGRIRHVHPGGEFHPGTAGGHWPDHSTCNREYEQIRARIEQLLAEVPGGTHEPAAAR